MIHNKQMNTPILKRYGAGIGLRFAHIKEIIQTKPEVPWFEVHIDNFIVGDLNRMLLSKVNEHYPLSFHGVNLNLGGVNELDKDYLVKLKEIIKEMNPILISEHACFNAFGNQHYPDLLPIPYTEEAVFHMAKRIDQVQETIERKILIENISRYYNYPESDLTEAQFLSAVSEETSCGLLLDLNNAYVNQHNHEDSVELFVSQLPLERVEEVHLAGFSQQGDQLIDTHANTISEEVWGLYENFVAHQPDIPCLIEWDSDLPELSTLIALKDKAQNMINTYSNHESLC